MPWFKRAFRGLYSNRVIQFGNKVSHAENKSRRTWKPNVQKTTLVSEALGERFQMRVTTHALRCIRKAGGFDNYLVKTPDSTIKYKRALDIKRRVIAARSAQPPPGPSSPESPPTLPASREPAGGDRRTGAETVIEADAAPPASVHHAAGGTPVMPLKGTRPAHCPSRGLADLLL